MSTIGIADNNFKIRQGLKQILELSDDLDVVFEASDGEEAVEHVKDGKNCPDLLLILFYLPGFYCHCDLGIKHVTGPRQSDLLRPSKYIANLHK